MTLTSAPTTSNRVGDVAARMAAVVAPFFGGEIPVRLHAWDGSEAGPQGAPTVVVRDPAALRRLVYRPGELGLAQAYVTGEIDVEGDLLEGFRRVWAAARERGASPRLTPGVLASGLRTATGLGALGLPPAPALAEPIPQDSGASSVKEFLGDGHGLCVAGNHMYAFAVARCVHRVCKGSHLLLRTLERRTPIFRRTGKANPDGFMGRPFGGHTERHWLISRCGSCRGQHGIRRRRSSLAMRQSSPTSGQHDNIVSNRT